MIDHCQFWIKFVQNVSFLTKLDQTCPNLFKSGCMAFQSVYKTDAVVCTYLHGNNSSCVLFSFNLDDYISANIFSHEEEFWFFLIFHSQATKMETIVAVFFFLYVRISLLIKFYSIIIDTMLLQWIMIIWGIYVVYAHSFLWGIILYNII